MKPRKIVLIAISLTIGLGTYAQRINRGDVCQDIPDLSTEQEQAIDKLSITHQKKMDRLREEFYAEPDGVRAAEIKTQMNTEMKDHYTNISGLLTPGQKVFLDQNCYASRRAGSYGRGFGRNAQRNRCVGQGYGRGSGRAYAQNRGRGQGRGYRSW